MSAIHDLIAQIGDLRLRERLAAEWASASREKKFGLVFEDHLPELLPLHKARPRKGDLVCRRQGSLADVWQVRAVHDGIVTCVKPQDDAHPSEPTRAAVKPVQFSVDEVLVVREFGEPIFPALVPMDAVANGPADAPWHTLIEADNYHALQLLDYLYAGQVDCIYIDPPYNTGARDWKYNNDYVDGNDGWRHSKWLAFMEKRLKLAKRLMKPDTGVLIVTIDEKEYVHLGMLLEQLFRESKIQMVSSVINPKGTGRENELLRINEFIFLVWNPSATIGSFESTDQSGEMIAWETMRRRNLASKRGRKGKGACGPNQFYPIYVNLKSGYIQAIGDPLSESAPLGSAKKVAGCVAVWPVRPDGTEMNWSLTAEACKDRWKKGYVRAGKKTPDAPQKYIIQFLPAGAIEAIESGAAEVTETRLDGSIGARFSISKDRTPTTQWNIRSHNAEHFGTNLLKEILSETTFPFPKSVYAVRDTLKIFAGRNPRALIVDFFAGSGTTVNAVNLLNSTDEGRRRCILVTNNEVSAEDAETLRARGVQPGDEEWEALGICRSITWPRSRITVLGCRDDGAPLAGEWLLGKMIEIEKGRHFKQIGFTDAGLLDTPAKKKQLVSLIDKFPQNLVGEECPFIASKDYKASVLFEVSASEAWLEALDGQDHITDFYIVTPVKKRFDEIKAQVVELLGPLRVPEEEKRPMSAGFPANLAYFKLDFLEKERVSLRRAFREILPLLWLKAGAVGARPELARGEPEPALFDPKGSNFVVLLNEARMGRLLKALAVREGLSYVFIVTDADESFKSMAQEVIDAAGKSNPGLQVVQLYRDYLHNFMINKDQGRAQDPAHVDVPAAAGRGGKA